MFCPNCGGQLPDNAQFCGNCGTPVEAPPEVDVRRCSNCGNELADDAVFCGSCGAAVEQKPEATTETEPEVMAAPAEPEINIRHCPNCGNELADDAVFCGNCGANLNDDEPATIIANVPESPVYEEAPDTALEQTIPANSSAETAATEPATPISVTETPAVPEKNGNKKPLIIGIVCVIAVVAIAAAFILLGKSAEEQQTPPAEETDQQTAANDYDFSGLIDSLKYTNYIEPRSWGDLAGNSSFTDDDYMLAYSLAIQANLDAKNNGLNIEELLDGGFNELLFDYTTEELGYTLIDLNDDDLPELITSVFGEYDADRGAILDVYTVKDGELICLLQSTGRNRYYLCDDLTISNSGSNSASESFDSYYVYLPGGSGLKLLEQVIYEEEYDPNNPYLYRTPDIAVPKPISEAEASSIKGYHNNMALELTPFEDMTYTNTTTDDSSEYILPDSDSRYIDESELYGLSAEDCRLARNELYARHGRKFNSADLQDYFNAKSWYNPTVEANAFSDSMFNEYEKANRDLIMAYEKAQGYN